ncbi:MAG: plasmid replication initiator [Anaerolineaceae bacterium]|nr:plasmid replication initiator [Anaerolineaceae bacterium]
MDSVTPKQADFQLETPAKDVLLPERHPQHDLFVCDVADAVLKDDMASMEHPFYSLSKKPETNVRRYEQGCKWLEVVPSVKGLATIYDKDILIYCISQMIAKINRGEAASPYVKIVAKDLLVFINRTTGGKDYEALKDALDRLDGTRIRTNVITGGVEEHSGFGLIDSFKIQRSEKTGRILEMSVKLSDWVFRSIKHQEVLTLHRDYFRLRKPIERRVYEVARKHCGRQARWTVTMETLKKKCGSHAPLKGFRYTLRQIAKSDHLPDYHVQLLDDSVTFINRETMPGMLQADRQEFAKLHPTTYEKARRVAPGYDVYYLENEWRGFWLDSGKPVLANPDAAFIGFCQRRYERNPSP